MKTTTASPLDENSAGFDFWQAVRDSGPILLGVVPFGITCGVMGLTAGLSAAEVVMMSAAVFAGASQFVSINMLGAGISGLGIIIFTTLLINLRHLLLGASLAPYMIKTPIPMQALLAFWLTDEAYAVTVGRIHKVGYSMYYQLGAAAAIYIVWVLSTMLGVVAGSYIPDPLAWGLDFAMPATFLVLLFPLLTNRVSLIVCIVAGITAVLVAMLLPGKWYIIIACVAATITGGILEGGGKDA